MFNAMSNPGEMRYLDPPKYSTRGIIFPGIQVYSILHPSSGMRYVGSTQNIFRRHFEHSELLRTGYGTNSQVRRLLDSGNRPEDFVWEFLEWDPDAIDRSLESQWIEKWRPSGIFNLAEFRNQKLRPPSIDRLEHIFKLKIHGIISYIRDPSLPIDPSNLLSPGEESRLKKAFYGVENRQKREIESLKSEIESLKSEVESLKSEVESLESGDESLIEKIASPKEEFSISFSNQIREENQLLRQRLSQVESQNFRLIQQIDQMIVEEALLQKLG